MKIRRFKVEKILRDKVPELLKEHFGIDLSFEKLSGQKLVEKLKEKVVEEATEVLETTKSRSDLIEELADLQETVIALCAAATVSFEEIEAKRLEKKERRGGFEKGIYGKYSDMDADDPRVEEQARKYEEIDFKDQQDG